MKAEAWTDSAFCPTMARRFRHLVEKRILLLWELAKLAGDGHALDVGEPIAQAVEFIRRRVRERENPKGNNGNAEGDEERKTDEAENAKRRPILMVGKILDGTGYDYGAGGDGR